MPTATADLNDDGNLDLIFETGWAPGDGAGHFGTLIALPDATSAADGGALAGTPQYMGVGLADFNGDQLTDVARIVSYGASGTWLAVSVATSKGTFPTTVLQAEDLLAPYPGQDLSSPLPCRLTDAGTVDLVLAESANELVPVVGDGGGGFRPGSPISVGSPPTLSGAVVGDFDGDGNVDVAASDGSNNMVVTFGDGNGGLGSAATTTLSGFVFAEFVAADLNGDGKTDIIGLLGSPLFNPTLFTVSVMLSEGRTFAPPQQLRTASISGDLFAFETGLPQLATGDLNADGVPDIALVSDDYGGTWTVQAVLVNVLQ